MASKARRNSSNKTNTAGLPGRLEGTPSGVPALEREIKNLRVELSRAQARLTEAEMEKNEYLQNVAHQLTSPLNAIKLNIEALLDANIELHRKGPLLRALDSLGTTLVHLIKNFSLMSHIEEDHDLDSFRDKPEELDLLQLCRSLCNDFYMSANRRSLKLVVEESTFARLRNPKVLAIRHLFSQVLFNLLDNAVKYSDTDTSIRISAEAFQGRVVLYFENSGLPINDSQSSRIFERRFRGTGAADQNPAGTGVGLYLARRIMEIHNGGLDMSTDGKRHRFRVVCPSDGRRV